MTDAVQVDPAEMPVVFACDVGSVSAGACHWAQDRVESHTSGDLTALADAIVAVLRGGHRVALGIECPLFFPCPDAPAQLGKARVGDCVPGIGNRAYSAPAGACSTVTGVPILAWVLRAVHSAVPSARGTTDLAAFARGETDLLVWEAFITGPAKGPHHLDDAFAAIAEFVARWTKGMIASDASAEGAISLAAATLLWGGWSDDATLLRLPCLVVRPPTPPPAAAAELAAVPTIADIDGVSLFREHDWRTLLLLRPDVATSDFERGSGYALSIDGNAYVRDVLSHVPEIAILRELMRVRQKDGTFSGKFVALRAALFLLQRSIKWSEGSMYDAKTRADFASCHAAVCAAWAREAKWHLTDALAADHEARLRLASRDAL